MTTLGTYSSTSSKAVGMEVLRRATKRARSHYHTDQSHAAGFSPTGKGCMIPNPGQAENVLKAGGEEGYRWYLMPVAAFEREAQEGGGENSRERGERVVFCLCTLCFPRVARLGGGLLKRGEGRTVRGGKQVWISVDALFSLHVTRLEVGCCCSVIVGGA